MIVKYSSFRPLIGVNFCKHIPLLRVIRSFQRVSVPLSGLVSVNMDKKNNVVVDVLVFSSPYRG